MGFDWKDEREYLQHFESMHKYDNNISDSFDYQISSTAEFCLCKHCASKCYISDICYRGEQENDVLGEDFDIESLGLSKSSNYQFYFKDDGIRKYSYCDKCDKNGFKNNYLEIFGKNMRNFASPVEYRSVPYPVKQALRLIYIQTQFEYVSPIELGQYARSQGDVRIVQKNVNNPLFALKLGFILQDPSILYQQFPYPQIIKEYHKIFIKTFSSLWDNNYLYREYYASMLQSSGIDIELNISSSVLFGQLQTYFKETMKTCLHDGTLQKKYGNDVLKKLIYWFSIKKTNEGKEYVHIQKGNINQISLKDEKWLTSPTLYSSIFFELYPNGLGDMVSPTKFSWYSKALMKSALDWFQMSPEWSYLAYMRGLYNDVRLQKHNVRSTYSDITAKEAIKGLQGSSNMFKKMSEKIVGSTHYLREHFYQIVAHSALHTPPNAFITLTIDEKGLPELSKLLNPDFFLSQQPATVINHILQRLKVLNLTQLKWSSPKEDALLGKITNYFIRSEYQKRGTIHFHILLWLENPEIFKGLIAGDYGDDSALRQLVLKHQIHEHRDNCLTKSGPVCKYGYPRPWSQETAFNEDWNTYLYPCKEGEEMIVPYIPQLLLVWKSNIDTKLISGGADETFVHYVLKYIHKSPDAKPGVSDFENFLSRIFTVVETIGRINQNKQIRTNIWAMKLDWAPSNAKLLKPKSELVKIRDVDPESKDIFYHKKIKLYRKRHKDLEELSYAEYFEHYSVSKSKPDGFLHRDKLGNYVKEVRPRAIYVWPTTSMNLKEQAFMFLVLFYPHRKLRDLLPVQERDNSLKNSEIVAGWKNYDFHVSYFYSLYEDWDRKTRMESSACFKFLQLLRTMNKAKGRRLRPQGPTDIKENKLEKIKNKMTSLLDKKLELMNKKTQCLFSKGFIQAIFSLDAEFEKLNTDQKSIFIRICQAVVEYILDGRLNYGISIQGEAGTGKSFLIAFIKKLCLILGLTVEIAAPTGQAACNAEGITVHKLFNLPKGVRNYTREGAEQLATNYVRGRVKSLDVLIIDEVSMLGAETLEVIEQIMRKFNNDLLFGGKLIIFVGDFLQLNPVKQRPTYLSELWSVFVQEKYRLEQNLRQEHDPLFQAVLSELRYGEVSRDALRVLKSRVRKRKRIDTSKTYLFGKKEDVRFHLEECMKKRKGKIMTAHIQEKPTFDDLCRQFHVEGAMKEKWRERYEKKLMSLRELKIFIGMPLMLLSNTDNPKFVNGSLITVWEDQDLEKGETMRVHLFADKSQYIELSRVEQFIRFDNNAAMMTMQYPVVPSYAMTIHKVQGKTLDSGVINAADHQIFDEAQAYTAFSRFRRLEDFTISALGKNIFKVNPKSVEEFKSHMPVSVINTGFIPSSILLGLQTEESKERIFQLMANEVIDVADFYIGRSVNSLEDYCRDPNSYDEKDIKFGKRDSRLEDTFRQLIDQAKEELRRKLTAPPEEAKKNIVDLLLKANRELREAKLPPQVLSKIDQAFRNAQTRIDTEPIFGKRKRSDDIEWPSKLATFQQQYVGMPSIDNTCYFNALSIILAKAGATSDTPSYNQFLTELRNGSPIDRDNWWQCQTDLIFQLTRPAKQEQDIKEFFESLVENYQINSEDFMVTLRYTCATCEQDINIEQFFLSLEDLAIGQNSEELIQLAGINQGCHTCQNPLNPQDQDYSTYILLFREYDPNMPHQNTLKYKILDDTYTLQATVNRAGNDPSHGHYWATFYSDSDTVTEVDGDQVKSATLEASYFFNWRAALYKLT